MPAKPLGLHVIAEAPSLLLSKSIATSSLECVLCYGCITLASVLLALTMQICEAARMPDEPRSFCNTWIEHLVVSLPSLEVAIDDSLMALVERCVQHLAAASATSPAQSQSTGQGNTAGQAGRANPCSPGPGPSWTPSAGSPMTLLEQARQATQLNSALDNFGASTQTGGKQLLLFVYKACANKGYHI